MSTPRGPGGIRPGLCSVTYRELPAERVLALAAGAGLRGIEWGADVHAPPGDPDRLVRLRDATLAAGLAVGSYGSYVKAGPHGADEFAPVLAAAVALGAPRIRIWAGTVGSRDAGPDGWRRVVSATRTAADMAADHGIQLGYEFHGDTLTDSVDTTLRLLDEVDRPNVATYWQPPVGVPADEAVAGLLRLRERVCALHVFSWWPGIERLPLADRADLWRSVFGVVHDVDALLEFVPDDDPQVLSREAAVLAGLGRSAGG